MGVAYITVTYFINKINKSGEMTGEKLEKMATFYENMKNY